MHSDYLFVYKVKGRDILYFRFFFSSLRNLILYMHFIDYICRFSTSSLLLTLQNLGSCFFPWLSVKTSQIQYDRMMEVTLSQSLYVSVSYSCTCIKNVNGIIYHLHVHTCIHTGRGRWVTCTWHIKILLGEMFVHR